MPTLLLKGEGKVDDETVIESVESACRIRGFVPKLEE